MPSGPARYSFAVRGQGNIKVILCPTAPVVPEIVCNTYTVPWNYANPGAVQVPCVAGTYTVTTGGRNGSVVIVYYSSNGIDSLNHQFTTDETITFTCTGDFLLQAQYGYANEGLAPTVTVCKIG